jgi:DnaK suppressor protein
VSAKKPSTFEHLETLLRTERDAVLAAIGEHLHASGDSSRLSLLNHLEAVGDWIEADLLNDTDIALLSHELVRLRDIDAALARLKAGNFGVCIDCGEAIPEGRLSALPTAQSCVRCQENYEKRHGLGHGASL